jgi:hypothetical protein
MRGNRRAYWKPIPFGAQDLWRIQPWPGGVLALARTLGAWILLVLFSFLPVLGCLFGWWHSFAMYRKWAGTLPEMLERAMLGRALACAVAHRILVQTSDGYVFSDPALRAELTARYQSDREASGRGHASKTVRSSVRFKLLAFLDDRGIDRISAVVVAGAGVYVMTVAFTEPHAGPQDGFGIAVPLVILLFGGFIGVRAAAPLLRWSVASVAGLSRADAATVAVLVTAMLAALITWSGPALATALAAALPASFVAACGLWVLLLTRRALCRHRARRMLGLHLSHGPLAYLPDAIVVVTIGVVAAVLHRRSLLTAGPATVLLFPIATWGSFRCWRAMNHSRRLPVRASADLTLSLLLGAELVLFAVWLVNLLGLPRAEVSALRAILDRGGRLADVPWWTWAAVYLVLAASVALARWPGLPRRVTDLLRIAPAVSVTKRVLTGVHVGLLVIIFIAVAAPATVTPLLRHQIRVRYDVALQRELLSEQVLDAYTWIVAELEPIALRSGILRTIVVTIHSIGHQSPGDKWVATENDLGRRLGILQATTLQISPPPPQIARTAGDIAPSLDEKLGKLATEEQETDVLLKRAEQIGEYTANAIASTISIPNVGDHEVVQIVREYLNGLIEESPLKDVIAAWYRKVRWHVMPLPADEIVVPDATRLEKAASAELGRAVPRSQDVASALKAARNEPPAVADVELTNATRYRQEGTGPCDSICRLATPPGTLHEPAVKPPEPREPDLPADPFRDIPHL